MLFKSSFCQSNVILSGCVTFCCYVGVVDNTWSEAVVFQRAEHCLEKVERVMRQMRWKAFFFDRNEQDNIDAINNDNFGFKSRKFPPQDS